MEPSAKTLAVVGGASPSTRTPLKNIRPFLIALSTRSCRSDWYGSRPMPATCNTPRSKQPAMKRVRSGARTGFARFKKNTEQNTSRSPARTILARSKPSITKQRKRCSSPVRKRQGWFCFTHNLFPMKQRLRRIPVCLCLLRRSRCRGRLPWYISGPSGNLLYCC